MSASAKKITAVVVALLAAVALGGYFVFIPQQEKKYEQEIAAFIEALPGDLAADAIKVNFLKNSAEIHGLRGATKYIMDSDLQVDIASMTLTGLNFSLGKKPGIEALADSFICSDASANVTTKVEGLAQSMTQNLVFKNFELHNLKGDASAVNDLLGDAPLARKLDIAATFSAGPVRIDGYVNTTNTDFGPIVISLDSGGAEESSLLTAKNVTWEKMRFSAMNTEFIVIDRMALASMKMPNFLAPMLEASENKDPDAMGQAILSKISDSPIEMRGLVMEGFRLQFMTPEAVTIKKLEMDLEASASRLTVKKNVEGFVLPPSMYGHMSVEAAQFSAYYQKPLDIDMRIDLEMTQKNGTPTEVFVNDLFVQDKNLASAQIKAEALDGSPMSSVYGVFTGNDALSMKKGELVLEDKAFLETYFQAEIAAHAGEQPQGGARSSVADVREKAAQRILGSSSAGNATLAALAEGVAKFLKTPGKLSIACNPATPLVFDTLTPATLDSLGATVEFTPAN